MATKLAKLGARASRECAGRRIFSVARGGAERVAYPFRNRFTTMSQHSSFRKGASASKKKRNVLKRFERIELMKKRGQWKEGRRMLGLPKTLLEE